jgi:RNA polymerase sigma factor (TIGR02999 family)
MKVTKRQIITKLLENTGDGKQVAINELFELFYDELQKIAHARCREWHGHITINTAALLHETCLRLLNSDKDGDWKSKTHFLAVASKAMRHILINYKRDRCRIKRGGGKERVSLEKADLTNDGEFEVTDEKTDTLILLDDALQKLDLANPRLSQIVECRIFKGMTIRETATALDIPPITVNRGWNTARLWLNREMKQKLEA